MKIPYLKKVLLILALLLPALISKAQQNDDLLNLLIKRNVISQDDADSLRADLAIKQQADKAKQNKFPLTLGKALNLSGLLQTRYQAFQQKTKFDGLDVRRARLDLKGAITNHWDYDLYVEFAGPSTRILDANITYKFDDYLKLTAGQFKIPFSLESLTSDASLELPDRSQVEEALAARKGDVLGDQNGRDIGVQASGSFVKIDDFYLFDYTFAVLNGAGIDVSGDNNKNKDLAGRFTVHPVKNLSISYDFYNGHDIYGSSTATQTRNRRGVDARYVYGPLSLTAEYDRGSDGKIDRDGWYGQAAYFVLPKQLQFAAKVDTYDPTKTNFTDRSTYYTGGFNYFFNSWTKLSLDYSYRREEVPTKQIQNNLLVAQLQLQF